MIITFSIKRLMGDTPPPLWKREGEKIFAEARNYGITQRGVESLDGDWSRMSLNIGGATKIGLMQYLAFVQAVSLTVQVADLDCLLSNEGPIKPFFREHFAHVQGELTDIPPDSLFDTMERLCLSAMAVKPPEAAPAFDPDSEYDAATGQYIGKRELRDEAYLEWDAENKRREEAERKALIDPTWESE